MIWRAAFSIALVVLTTEGTWAQPSSETLRAWESYVSLTQARVDSELADETEFRMMDFMEASERSQCEASLRRGDICVLKRETLDGEGRRLPVPSGMIHHWYGAVFVPDVGVSDILDFVQDYDESAGYYPEVESSRLLTRRGDAFDIFLRLKRKKILTVHYNTDHTVMYQTHSPSRASSHSVATRIREISRAGEPNESEKSPNNDRGFLWKLQSYWRFEQSPDGTTVECESISLSRSVPAAARWLVKSYVDSVPRESLESTLTPIRENVSAAQ